MRIPLLNEAGTVVNVVEADENWVPPAGLTRGETGGEIGDTWTGASYERPADPEPVLTEADYADAIQDHIDAVAKSRGYKDGFALAGYATSTVPAWAAEAAAYVAWRDAVWIYAYGQLALVESEERAQPTIEDLVAELPPVGWPT